MKFRHVGVSVDQMHEILKHSAHQKNLENYVKRIEDGDDNDEDFYIPGQSSVP